LDITEYRNSETEKARIGDLMRLLPAGIETGLDIGARDGFIAKLLADRISSVTALDLDTPVIDHARIQCVKGDVTALHFSDSSFNFVFCAEVLEHIPSKLLRKACSELSRVSNRYILIGVPFKQDIRVDRTTCRKCGGKNPPWGHVNSFDERRLRSLFPTYEIVKKSFVGTGGAKTNFLSCILMDMAGNPYGTYDQEEPCIHCGATLSSPSVRNLIEKVLTRTAFFIKKLQAPFIKPQPNWIHVLFEKRVV
jgi:SAM-dependent methyltransferase